MLGIAILAALLAPAPPAPTASLVHAQPVVVDTAPVVPIPAPQALRQLPLRPHPRLFLPPGRLAEMREQIRTDPAMRHWYGLLRARADSFLSDDYLPRHEIPDGLRLLATSRRVLERVATLGLVGRVENDRRYRERVWRELQAAAAFPDWNPKHFLDVGEMTTAFAIGYDWFHDQWTPEQREAIEAAIVRHGLEPAMRAYRGEAPRQESWWVDSEHNWNQVTHGGVGIGALAVMEERPELASEVLHRGLSKLPLAMQHYGPDGAWNEGPGYWHYASLFNTLILNALETSVGTEFGLSRIPGYPETGWFPIYVTSPIGDRFSFADVGRGASPTNGAELLWMANRYGEPAFAAHQLRYGRDLRENRANPFNLIWYTPSLRGAAAGDAPLDRHFRVAEVVTMRSSWDNPDAVFVGFKAGDNRANHSNLDLGTFVLDALGVRWATELGSDDYNLPNYFDDADYDSFRWKYYRMRAEGQNTLVLNPDQRADQDPNAATRIVELHSEPLRAHAVADLSPAYERHARSVRRGIALLNGRRQVLVQDEIRARAPSQAWWFMHTEAEVEIGPDGSTATLTRDGKRLWARVLAPAGARFTVMDARPLPGTANPEGQNPNQGIRKLAVRLDGVTDARIAVLLAPLPAGEAVPTDLPAVRPLSTW